MTEIAYLFAVVILQLVGCWLRLHVLDTEFYRTAYGVGAVMGVALLWDVTGNGVALGVILAAFLASGVIKMCSEWAATHRENDNLTQLYREVFHGENAG